MNFSTTRSLRSLESTESTEEELGSNTLTGKIIGAAIDIHRALGPGLLEVDQFQRKISERGHPSNEILDFFLCVLCAL